MIRLYNLLFLFAYLFLSLESAAEQIISKRNDGCFFVMEKVDDTNIKQWYSFIEKAEANRNSWMGKLAFIYGIIPLEQIDESLISLLVPIEKITDNKILDLVAGDKDALTTLKKKYTILKDAEDGISNFKRALGNSTAKLGDVWIAYLSAIDPSTATENEIHKNIELAMTVLVKDGSLLSMHMGIFRNPFYFMSKNLQHQRISPELHAFAAKTAMAKYPSLQYMVTTPLSSMANIFKGVLPDNSYAEGMNKKGAWIERDTAGENKEPLTAYDKGFIFALYDRDTSDPQKKLVFLIDDNNKDAYWWLVGKLHISLSAHPYFVVRLKDLANMFSGDF